MDEKDLELADAITANMIEKGVAKARLKATMPEDFDGFCECGEAIPKERVALHFYNCVLCQTANERRHKFYNGP